MIETPSKDGDRDGQANDPSYGGFPKVTRRRGPLSFCTRGDFKETRPKSRCVNC